MPSLATCSAIPPQTSLRCVRRGHSGRSVLGVVKRHPVD
jgi:hypothetical protein